eukprot:TRINITY_DN82888_c0_g1_i1.p1 TRINITY_DN82888_c0_g1~~TRINITY_DN82888_c0_g1_i1.p1  ORF type:complete len:194 (+),score=35.76 TRINITY_DN82888_c0_g1_i1:31-612(+)
MTFRGFLGSAPRLSGSDAPIVPGQSSSSGVVTGNGFGGTLVPSAPPAASDCREQESAQHEGEIRSMIRREMKQAFAASVPPNLQRATSAPVQIIVQNSSTVNAEQKVESPPPPPPPPPRMPQRVWDLSRQDLADFWASPLNRICVLGMATLVFYIYQGNSQHKWRMSELQRRIDGNPFLRTVSQVLGSFQDAK